VVAITTTPTDKEEEEDVKGQINKGFHSDMNSQYPKAMLNKLPVGDPVFSTNTDLSYYFGFVYALIIPPS
jgi:hypothetical protein